jgi:amino acid transporter
LSAILSTSDNPQSSRHAALPKANLRKASLFYLVFVMFSYTTGGPFGLEDMVTTSGPGMTLVYLLVLPFFWCIPVSLVSAELTSAMPVEGGFYRWTRAAFGDFWGFLAGWWNWSASFLLGGAYAVLFSDYLVYYFPRMTWWEHWLISLALIGLLTWINIRGIQMVGQVATALEVFIFIPIVIMVVIGLAHWHQNPFSPFVVPHQATFKIFGVGLALGLWLYSGYEQLSTVAEEVENPQRAYPRALALVVPLSMAAYFLPTLAGLASAGHWQDWHTGYFSEAARIIGGNFGGQGFLSKSSPSKSWLGTWMTLAAMVGNVALLNSTILTTTRMPFAMAEDKYLPPALTRRHARYGTPWLAIVVSCVIYALLAWQSLGQLISVYIWLRSATTVLTVLSAWKLRRTHSELQRSFVVPGGRAGLLYVVGAPVVMAMVALLGSDKFALIGGAIGMALGPAVYVLLKNKS